MTNPFKIVFLFCLFSIGSFAQSNVKQAYLSKADSNWLLFADGAKALNWKLARIKDKDGFTYVRCDAGKKNKIVDTVRTGEIFLCNLVDSGSGYYPVMTVGYSISEGYMHKSRIEFVDSLPDSTHSLILHTIFKNYLDAYIEANKHSVNQNIPEKKYEMKLLKAQALYEYTFNNFCVYFNRTKDTLLLFDFFKADYNDDGAVAESAGSSFAICMMHNEIIFLNQLKYVSKSVLKRVIFNTSMGLGQYSDIEKDSKRECKRLQKELNDQLAK